MTMVRFVGYLYLFSVVVAVLWLICRKIVRDWRERRARLEMRYLRIVMNRIVVGHGARIALPEIKFTSSKALLLSLFAKLQRRWCGIDPHVFEGMDSRHNLSQILVHRTASLSSYMRCRWLAVAVWLPCELRVAERVAAMGLRRNRELAFLAAIVVARANPSVAAVVFGDLRFELSPLEVAYVLSLVKCDLLPLDYVELLECEAVNCQRIGVAIVDSFEIECGAVVLLRVLARQPKTPLAHQIIVALCRFGVDLGRGEIVEAVANMLPAYRESLFRALIELDCSKSQLEQICCDEELDYCSRFMTTHKRMLA